MLYGFFPHKNSLLFNKSCIIYTPTPLLKSPKCMDTKCLLQCTVYMLQAQLKKETWKKKTLTTCCPTGMTFWDAVQYIVSAVRVCRLTPLLTHKLVKQLAQMHCGWRKLPQWWGTCYQLRPGHPSYSNVTQQHDWEIKVVQRTHTQTGQWTVCRRRKALLLSVRFCNSSALFSSLSTHTHTDKLLVVQERATTLRK